MAALQSEYDTYKTTSETALTDAQDTLAALQTEYGTYQEDSQASLSEAQQAAASSAQAVAQLTVPTDTNGAGNQTNGNLAVYNEGTIYYHNNYESGHIYSENAAGYDDVYFRKTSSGDISYVRNIATLADGCLYYLNSNRLYRYDLAKDEAEYMKSNMDLYAGSGMLVEDGKIYFLKSPYDENGDPADNLYDIKFSCNNLEAVGGVRADEFTGDSEALYYVETDTGKVKRYDFASETSETLLDAEAPHT